jgi:flagellar motility protein MotE (MotC chaperone)
MGRFFLGVLTPIILILVLILGIWVSDLLGFVKINNLALDGVALLPGMKTIRQDYELGKKRTAVLLEKEDDLRAWESKLKVSEAKLTEDTAQFENERLEWGKSHLIKTESSVLPNQTTVATKVDDSETKKYLALVGGMKPDKAAAVVGQLPEETVLLLLKQLRSSQATKILESLPADYVARLTKKQINR